jgi:hypothetical protein
MSAGLLALCLLGLAVPSTAHADALFTGAYPGVGSTVLPPSGMGITADAESTVMSVSMTIDGAGAPANFEYEGYEDDAHDWIVTDDTIAHIWGSLGALGAGSHTAEVTVNTLSSGSSTYSWSFTVELTRPVVTTVSPENAARVPSLTPVISATVSDDDSTFTAMMTVNGSPVAPFYDSGSNTFLYTVSLISPLPDDTDIPVTIQVYDVHGIPSLRKAWSFRTAVAPVLSGLTPADGATVGTTRPMIGFTSTDGSPGVLHAHVSVDGSVVYDGSAELGTWRWMPPGALANNASHSVSVVASDADGNSASADWSFQIASTTTFTGMSPAPGSVVLSPGSIVIAADATTDINGVTVKVDGVEVWWLYTWLQRPGYEEHDTGDWIVTDWTLATVTATMPALSHGQHSVEVTLLTADGSNPSQAWNFEVDTPPVIATVVPGAGARAPTLTPVISASIVDDDATFACAMTVDGDSVTPVWDAGTKTYAYTPSTPLGDNTFHTASITVTDPDGFPATRTWTFGTHLAPELSAPVPADGSTVSVGRPDIGLTTWNDLPGTLEMRLVLDGRVVFSAPVEKGAWRWNPGTALDAGPHTVQATVTDVNGDSSELSWVFTVAPRAPLTVSECTRCHDYTTHTADSDCSTTCHTGAHYIGAYDCYSDCHAGPDHSAETFSGTPRWCVHHRRTEGRRQCADCHPGLQPMHTQATVDAVHIYAALPAECQGCHSTSLITEHEKYPIGWATKYDCAVCHESSRGAVRDAIAAKNVSCDACHANADHIGVHDATMPKASCTHAGCHVANLVSEHTGHGVTCAGCHGEGFALSGPFAGLSYLGSGLTLAGSGMPSAEGTLAPEGMIASALAFDPRDAVNDGTTACDACHAPGSHGNREDCESCHGAIPPTTDASEPTSTVTPAGAFATWSATGDNAAVPTPHKGYATTTTKCAVCHSVHKAPASGELLLRGTVAAACEYCHVYTSIGVVVVYGGDEDVYYAAHDNFSHNATSDSSCRSCHSVHGANTLEGAKAGKILRDWSAPDSGRAYSAEALVAWPDPKTTSDDDEQITAWCTGCHSYYVDTYETAIPISSFEHTGTYAFTSQPGKTHVMRPAGAYGNTAASPDVQGTAVAYAGSTTCRSCHDAGSTDEGPGIHGSSFPHSTPGYYRFMTSAESLAAEPETNTVGTVDGLCLKCHRADAATGVGLTY